MKENLSSGSKTRVFLRNECPSPVPLVGNSVEIFDSITGKSRSARLERTEVASQRSSDGLVITTTCFYNEIEPIRS